MGNITFGKLLEKLLYLSNQKKSALAKAVGYDTSYISKWINGKNLPTQKSISDICKITSNFIVESLNMSNIEELKNYFEINDGGDIKVSLAKQIEKILKESYMYTAKKSVPNLYKKTHSEENYNSIIHINPRLGKQYLSKDISLFMNKSKELDLIISVDLYNLDNSNKTAITDMKKYLLYFKESNNIRVRFLMCFNNSNLDIINTTMMIINMIAMHPEIKLQIFNYEVDSNVIIYVIKNRIFYSAMFTKDKKCLFTNMSKDNQIVADIYYSLDEMTKNQSNEIVDIKSSLDIIKKRIYLQYIMGQDLRWIIGCINELLMPYDLFDEISRSIFGNDEEILKELKKINMLLHNIIYKSKLKILIYELDIKEYISIGNLNFFNIPIKLSFEQRERHINYIKTIMQEFDNIEIKLIDSNLSQSFNENQNSSIYLSKTLKMITINPIEGKNEYAIIKDNEFKNICDKLFDNLWNLEDNTIISNKEDVLEIIGKTLDFKKIINESLKYEDYI